MNNQEFLNIIGQSFKAFLGSGSRSNAKLKVLHGAIAADLRERLGEGYAVHSLDEKGGKEMTIRGRYIDKHVDITITKDGNVEAGVGVKFIMQNYSQNSNNYFENMMGETANIRCAEVPYFQIIILPDCLPYYEDGGKIKKWETFTAHNAEKYITLSRDNSLCLLHTPNKTLLYVVHLPETDDSVTCRKEYAVYYDALPTINVTPSENDYGEFFRSVVYNDYETFINKVAFAIRAL